MDIVIGITTWKKRIFEHYFKRTLFRLIAEQKTQLNYKVCLVLAEAEFPNKYDDIPSWIAQLEHCCDNFEVIWVKDNTRAWKKLDPVMEKYPDLPIITTDDNKLLKVNAIQKLYEEYQARKCILSCKNAWGFIDRNKEFITGTPRLYPPHSLYDLDVKYFMTDFLGLQADVFNAIRAVLKNTPAYKLDYDLIETIYAESRKNSLGLEYSRTNWRLLQKNFLEKHSDLKQLWEKNIR